MISKEDGQEAIEFLSNKIEGEYPKLELIFLDINMPNVDGWEFLQKYDKLPIEAKGEIILMMLTTSQNPEDKIRATMEPEVTGFRIKPLDTEMLNEILKEHFSDYL